LRDTEGRPSLLPIIGIPMSDLSIELHWQRTTPVFATGTYSNSHIVQMNRLHEIDVDSAPDWGGDPAHTNPEQALASAIPVKASAKNAKIVARLNCRGLSSLVDTCTENKK